MSKGKLITLYASTSIEGLEQKVNEEIVSWEKVGYFLIDTKYISDQDSFSVLLVFQNDEDFEEFEPVNKISKKE